MVSFDTGLEYWKLTWSHDSLMLSKSDSVVEIADVFGKNSQTNLGILVNNWIQDLIAGRAPVMPDDRHIHPIHESEIGKIVNYIESNNLRSGRFYSVSCTTLSNLLEICVSFYSRLDKVRASGLTIEDLTTSSSKLQHDVPSCFLDWDSVGKWFCSKSLGVQVLLAIASFQLIE